MIRLYVTPFFLFLLLLWVGSYSPVFAREIPLPEEEAPKALFSAELYDANVDFLLRAAGQPRCRGAPALPGGMELKVFSRRSFLILQTGLSLNRCHS